MAVLSASEANRFFKEDYYLDNNPDVQNAVENNVFDSGLDHFLAFGLDENRAPNQALSFFSEETYLAENPDVQAAVNDGIFESGLDHFLSFGVNELNARGGSTGFPFFDSENYLANNPDVEQAVDDGILDSALEHYVKFGFSEGRSGLFTIDADNLVVDEGGTLNFTVETFNQNNVNEDTEVEYSLAGDIDLGDIVGESLTGTAIIEAGNNSTTFSVDLAEDASTEGLEILTAEATVNNSPVSTQAVVNDTSVTPSNTAPVASNDNFTTQEGTEITLSIQDLLGNDSDEDGDSLAIESTSSVENGTLEENVEGFTPGEGAIQHQGTVTFNEAITVGNFSIGYNAERVGDERSGFFVTDNVSFNTALFDVSNPENLTVEEGSLNLSGADLLVSSEFAQLLSDQGLASEDLTGADVGDVQVQATVSESDNGDLVVEDGVTSVSLDADLLESAAGLTLSGTDSEASPAEGFDVGFGITEETDFSLEESISGFTFTPEEDFTGEASFQYTVSDGNGGTDTASVSIDVEGGNGDFMLDEVVTPETVTEGETLTVTVNTSNVADGETVNYELSGDGIEAADFDDVPLTGTIEINDNTGSLELPVVSDQTEEGEETLTTTISSGAMTVTSDTVINDSGNGATTVDLDGLGTQQNPASEDAGTEAIQYTDSANDPNFVEIANFGADDSIQFENAQAEDVVVTPGANTNLTINNAGTVSNITLNGVSTDFTVQTVSDFNELDVGDVTFA